jgi:hypothetical protein
MNELGPDPDEDEDEDTEEENISSRGQSPSSSVP